jgi:hypothetical protein
MTVQVTNKALMYQMLRSGRFGNTARIWPTLADLQRSGYQGLVSLRRQRRDSPTRQYHVPAAEVPKYLDQYGHHGITLTECPPEDRVIQGEVCEVPGHGWCLTYTFTGGPMRFALEKDAHTVSGLCARKLLRATLDPSGYEWIEQLLEDFPEHVVEFSQFPVPLGTLKQRLLVWEVRSY